jgi:TIR domain
MPLIFISYRRDSVKPYADRLRDHLAAHFGEEEVFLDEASIRPGELWRAQLQQKIENAVVALAIIDSNWLESFAHRAERSEPDFVRFELEIAIKLRKTIMPLLVGGHELKKEEALEKLPPELYPILEHQFHSLDDRIPAAYETSIKTLIVAIDHLDERFTVIEDKVIGLLMAKDYVAAERLLMRQASSTRQAAILSVYLALARLAGRSFNALYPVERETIERLLRRARASAPERELPRLLLAIMEIDYYELNGLKNDTPVSPGDVVHGGAEMDDRWRKLLLNLNVSLRARHDLGLDTLLSGAAR